MVDSRLVAYRRALGDMVKGVFPRALPVAEDDDVGRLGFALLGLSQTLENRFTEQRLLNQVTEQANAGLLLDEILNELYTSFRGLIPYDRIGLALLEDDGRLLRARWGRSDANCIYLKTGFSASMQGSSLKTILHTGKPRILNDLEDYLRAHPDSKSTALVVKEGVRASLTCPLVAVGKPVGFLFFSSFEKNAYRHAHVDLFIQIANQLSSIVEKSRLYEELQHVNSELQTAQEKLKFLAGHDALTGLNNRRMLNEYLQREWNRAIRAQTPVSAVMIDVDSFKTYNDSHGHLAGDECLRAVAGAVADGLRRPADFAARYGGEEFLVLLPETGEDGARRRAEYIRASIEALQIPHGHSAVSAVVTVSAGTATLLPHSGSSPATLLSAADSALYQAKRAGRNQVFSRDQACGEGALAAASGA
jgi:diguanylate cyclase (GGDEF)-like protein